MASPAKRQGPHQPQSSSISSSAGPVDQDVDPTRSSTPGRELLETPQRSTRSSGQRFEVQTLPGTRWDELDIERIREQQRGREPRPDSQATPSLDRLPLHHRRRHHRTESSTLKDHVESAPGKGQKKRQSRTSGALPPNSQERISSQPLATSVSTATAASPSPVRRDRTTSPQNAKHKGSQHPRERPTLETDEHTQSPHSALTNPVEKGCRPNMARRPGRNQVDLVAELKETIHESLSKLSDIQEKLASLGQQVMTTEEELKVKESDGSVTLDDANKLDELYRAMVKLTEQETAILQNPPDDPINKMGILNALAGREDTQAPGRGSAASKQRGSKRSTLDNETAATDSPGPSPSDVRSSDQLRRVKGQSQRSSSVASQTPRDGASRLEDGLDGSRSTAAERVKMLVLHAEVAYKQSKTTHDSDGERIHCTINGIRKDKGSGRAVYDIKDKDESDLLYTARAEDLLPIPPPNSQLPSFAPGRHVIALYPGTTTFYNAQVIGLFTKRDVYSLKFEGEENEKEVKEVERRYVLDTKAK